MSVVFIVLPIALLLAAAAVAAFAWALRGGQLDDLETPAVRILVEDDDEPAGTNPPEGDATGSEHDPPRS